METNLLGLEEKHPQEPQFLILWEHASIEYK